ncbi:MAG: PIN domain-containing protein [Actinobacteria bacterium]|nr:PIN domain-containing protein [Actinomycetota bacterium]
MAAREHAFLTVTHLWDEARDVFASRLTYVEAHAALAARARASLRNRRQLSRARRELDDRWRHVAVVELNEYVAEVAALAAAQHRLRGADAIHFASAAILGSSVTMVSRDSALRRAALAAGLDVAP